MATGDSIFLGIRGDTRGLEQDISRAVRSATSRTRPFRLNVDKSSFELPLGRIRAQLSDFDRSLDAASARVIAFGASVAIINSVKESFTALVRETIRVEEAIQNIQVVLGASTKQLDKFQDGLFDIARNTKQTFAVAADAAQEFARQGLGVEKTLQATNAALILTRLSGYDAVKSVEALTAAVNGFEQEGLTHIEIVNRMATVDAAFAVSSKDLADALGRAGSTAQDAGVSFNELLALTTAVQQQTARGGAVIGNAFKTIFARIQGETTINQLRDLGVAIDETTSGVDKLKAIGDALAGADTATQTRIQQLVGGVRQINIVSSIFRDLNRDVSLFGRAWDIANQTTDEAVRRNEELNKTLGALANESLVNIQETLAQIGEISLSGNLQEIFRSFNSLLEGIRGKLDSDDIGGEIGKSILEGLGNFVTGPGLVIIGGVFLKLFKQVSADALKAFQSFSFINKEVQRQQALQKLIESALQSQVGLYDQITTGARSQVEQEKRLLELFNQQIQAKARLQALSKDLAKSETLSKVFVSPTKGLQVKNAAEGSLPPGLNVFGAFSREQAAISRGIGGASKSANPVLIPDFKFGKGRTGPLVANTDEYIVDNFDGKGSSAILTKKMVKDLGGLEELKKIGGRPVRNAASGFEGFKGGQLRFGAGAIGDGGQKVGGQFLSQTDLSKLNKAISDYQSALASGTTEMIRSATKIQDEYLEKLGPESVEKVKIALSKIRTNRYSDYYANKSIEDIEKSLPRPGLGGGTSGLASDIKSQRAKTARATIAASREAIRQSLGSASGKFQSVQNVIREEALFGKLDKGEASTREISEIKDILRRRKLASVGLNETEINSLLNATPKSLDKFLKGQIKDLNKVVNDIVSSKLLASTREKEQVALQEFNKAQTGFGATTRRLFSGQKLQDTTEFQGLSPVQQKEILAQRTLRSRLGRTGQFLNNNRFTASIATSLLAPVVSNLGERTGGGLGKGISTLGGVLEGASFGALFGPVGIGIGAVAGGLKTLAEVSDSASNNVRSLNEVLEKQSAETAQTVDSITQFISKQQSLGSLIESGANSQQIRRAQSGLTGALSSIPNQSIRSEIASIISKTSGDPQERIGQLQDILAREQERGNQQTKLVQTALRLNQAEVSGRSAFNIGGIFGDTALGKVDIASAASDLAVAISSLDENKAKDIRDALESLDKEFSQSKFAETLDAIGISSKSVIDALGGDLDKFQLISQTLKNINFGDELKKIVDAEVLRLQTIRDINKPLAEIVQTSQALSRVRSSQGANSFAASQQSFDLQFAFAKFADPIVEAQVDVQKEIAKINYELGKQNQELSESFRESAFDIVKESRGSLDDSLTGALDRIISNPNLSLTPELLDNLAGILNSIKNSDGDNYQKVRDLLQNSYAELVDISVTTQGQFDTARRQLDFAKAEAREQQRQRNVNFLGGIDNILAPGAGNFSAFQGRQQLVNQSDLGGIFGARSLAQAAQSIVEFQRTFNKLGTDIRSFAPDAENIVRRAVSEVVDAQSAKFPELNLDTAGITSDIVKELFGDNELTAQSIADAIGKDPSISGTAASAEKIQQYTDNTVAKLDTLISLFQTSRQVDEQSKLINQKRGSIKERLSDIGTLQGQLGELGAQSTFNKGTSVSAQDVVSIFGKENISKLASTNKVGLPLSAYKDFNSQKALDVSEFATAKIISTQINDIINSTDPGTLAEKLRKSGSFLGDIGKLVDFEDSASIGRIAEKFRDLGIISIDQNKAEELKSSITIFREEISKFESEIKAAESLIETLKNKPVTSTNNANPSSPSSKAGSPSVQNSPQIEAASKAVVNLIAQQAQNQRNSSIASITGSVPGSETNRTQRVQNRTLDSLSSNIDSIVSPSSSLREIEEALTAIDRVLEEVGLDLDDENIQRFLFGENIGKSIPLDSLVEKYRILSVEARSSADAIRQFLEDPFATVADQQQSILDLVAKLQILERQFGKNSEEVRKFKQELGSVAENLPEGALNRFFYGFDSESRRIVDELSNVQDRGIQIARQLSDGIVGAFEEAAFGAKSFGEAVKQVFYEIALEQARQFGKQAVSSLLSGAVGFLTGGNPLGGFLGGLFGGSSAATPTSLSLPGLDPSLLSYHTGGIVGKEEPVVAKIGEGVFTPSQMKALGLRMGESQNQQSFGALGGQPVIELKIVNLVEKADIEAELATSKGERAVINTISRNQKSVKQSLNITK